MLFVMLQTSIDDEFIHDFQYEIPLSESGWFEVYERSHTVPLVQTMYIDMCKEWGWNFTPLRIQRAAICLYCILRTT